MQYTQHTAGPHYEALILCKPNLADTTSHNETQVESTTSIYMDFFLQASFGRRDAFSFFLEYVGNSTCTKFMVFYQRYLYISTAHPLCLVRTQHKQLYATQTKFCSTRYLSALQRERKCEAENLPIVIVLIAWPFGSHI